MGEFYPSVPRLSFLSFRRLNLFFRSFELQQVQIFYAGRSRYLGVFESKQDASLVYENAIGVAAKSGLNRNSPNDEIKEVIRIMRRHGEKYLPEGTTAENNPKRKRGRGGPRKSRDGVDIPKRDRGRPRKRKSTDDEETYTMNAWRVETSDAAAEDGSGRSSRRKVMTVEHPVAAPKPDFQANGGVEPPTKALLRWQRLTMSEEQHRHAVTAGLRVKVLKKGLWRGGLISQVGSTGVEVTYSDSNSEWHDYPSVLIIVDDTSNGHHHLAARGKALAFVPPSDDSRHAMALAAAGPRDDEERKEQWIKSLCKKWSIKYAEPREGIAAREREYLDILVRACDNERAVDDLRSRNSELKTRNKEMREELIQLREVVDLFSQSIVNRDSQMEVLSRQLGGLQPPHVTAGEDSLSEADTECSEPVKKCKTSHEVEDPDCPIVI